MEERLALRPAQLLVEYLDLFSPEAMKKPVLDLACGDGHNGIFLATRDLRVVLADRSEEALARAEGMAKSCGVRVTIWKADLEEDGVNPLPEDSYAAILIFRYLHRPLIPCIKKAITGNGLLIYETYTVEQPRFGKPHNPEFLLKPGELLGWFKDWIIIHHYEGILEEPQRAVAQILCQKPA